MPARIVKKIKLADIVHVTQKALQDDLYKEDWTPLHKMTPSQNVKGSCYIDTGHHDLYSSRERSSLENEEIT